MDLRKLGWKDVVWMRLVQVKDYWRAFLKTIINLRVHKIRRIS